MFVYAAGSRVALGTPLALGARCLNTFSNQLYLRQPALLARGVSIPLRTSSIFGNLHCWRAVSQYLCEPALSSVTCTLARRVSIPLRTSFVFSHLHIGAPCLNTYANQLCLHLLAHWHAVSQKLQRAKRVGRLRTAWRLATGGKGGARLSGRGTRTSLSATAA
jgi:hypothetical protein